MWFQEEVDLGEKLVFSYWYLIEGEGMRVFGIANHVCFGVWDGLLVWIIELRLRGGCLMPIRGRLRLSRWLCWTLYRRLPSIFIGFTILTFSSKGKAYVLVNCFLFLLYFCRVLCIFVYFLLEFRWYQIKITMRWEDADHTSVGSPARVVQYEGTSIRATVVIF